MFKFHLPKFISLLLFSLLFLNSFWFSTETYSDPSTTNAFDLYIPRVTVDGQTKNVKNVAVNDYLYDGVMNDEDLIRYGWNYFSLNLAHKNNPQPNSGWLKIYKNDDSSESNLITEFGSSPLPISALKHSLNVGQNSILIVYIDSLTSLPVTPLTKLRFTFNYKKESLPIKLEIDKPINGTVFGRGVEQEIRFKLTNFRLTNATTGDSDSGFVKIFYDKIEDAKLLARITSSYPESDHQIASFSSKDFEGTFSKIPDSAGTKLIFQVFDNQGRFLGTEQSVDIQTNYFGTNKISTPTVEITDPLKTSNNIQVTKDRVFKISVKNFTILPNIRTTEPNESNAGYLQVLINGKPFTLFKDEFILGDYASNLSGDVNIEVQLLHKDFTQLNPKANDSISVIIVEKSLNDSSNSSENVAEYKPRFAVMLTLVLSILFVIIYSITRK